jgi:hypothetical protein
MAAGQLRSTTTVLNKSHGRSLLIIMADETTLYRCLSDRRGSKVPRDVDDTMRSRDVSTRFATVSRTQASFSYSVVVAAACPFHKRSRLLRWHVLLYCSVA